ncbi:uncharacterized protein [Sinocyclocheilus grahami]|uniref:uncharacterized protein n=1 Tax=Sinocyclocheilus grahami TaxID=75366 RepID=UPI0007AD31F1|nr:PREDICTED: uncharacterized protein LOC107566333 [Sinocyclocheilus grahami]
MEHLRNSFVLLFLLCSPWPSAGTTFLTHLGTLCIEDCKPDGGEYKCKTIDKDGRSQNMFCSPQENMDYWGRQCRADSMCGKYGEDYCWCRIHIFSWGYCGLVKADKKLIDSGEGTRITSRHRNRRVPEVIDTVDDKGNHIKTTFTAEAAPDEIIDGKQWRNDAENLINSWENLHLVDQARSNLIKSGNLRIDMQGIIKRNNQRYYNLQIQVNVQRKKGESTTVAQIIIPDEIPERYVRRAFLESFNRRARVFIEVSRY